MHELGIAQEIMSSLENTLVSRPDFHVRRVVVRIGVFQSVDAESLRFSFSVLARENPRVKGAMLQVEDVPASYTCRACGSKGELPDFTWACPNCNAWEMEVDGGDEIVLQSIEGEEGD